MPTKQVLNARLLNLFPAQKIREEWKSSPKVKAVAVRELSGEKPEAIISFAKQNHSYTKQHIYLYEHSLPLAELPEDVRAVPTLYDRTAKRKAVSFFYLLELSFYLTLGDPLETISLGFLWPILLNLYPSHADIRMTIMEKDVKSYLADPDRTVLNTKRSITEQDVLELVLLQLPNVEPMDLNRGIKKLWETDKIDAMGAKWKMPRATKIQNMDEAFLLKKDDPREYRRIKNSPLLQTTFRWLDEKLSPVRKFTVNPTQGVVTFRNFPSKPGSVDDVINEILRNN